jgi:hypothetical protein
LKLQAALTGFSTGYGIFLNLSLAVLLELSDRRTPDVKVERNKQGTDVSSVKFMSTAASGVIGKEASNALLSQKSVAGWE